jgi:hypothetical protein
MRRDAALRIRSRLSAAFSLVTRMSQILIRIGHLTFIVTIVIYVNSYDRYQNGRKLRGD